MADASDLLLQRLYDRCAWRIHGYPGDGLNGIMGAVSRVSERITFRRC